MTGHPTATTDEHWMRRALEAARRGPAADPNPRVGCVLVGADGQLLATGWHRGAGTPHAEVDALARVSAPAGGDDRPTRGATAYVTLEPCCHTGRTRPCTEALLTAGVTRVVHAQHDPNPAASGGAAWLADHGVEVRSGVLADEAGALNRSWTHLIRSGRPWVTWKYAATLDGRSAAADGSSRWLTGTAARTDVHQRRAGCGAIVVGTGTALADDPQLTVRVPHPTPASDQQPPLRVVMGRRPLPATARVLDDAAPTLLHTDHDPATLLAILADKGIHHVWLEGGPTLAAALLTAGLVDEVIAYVAPLLLGAGQAALGDLGITTLADTVRLELSDVTRLGDDVRIIAHPSSPTTNSPTRTEHH